MKRMTKNLVYDFMHRSVVSVLIGFTAVGTAYLGYKGLIYLAVTRPARKQLLRKQAEEKVATEQSAREAELLLQQKDAETLRS